MTEPIKTTDNTRVPLPTEIIVDPEVTPTTIEMAFSQWLNNQKRYDILEDYYLGKHQFSPVHQGDGQNKIVANHCKYITDVLVGYQYGNEPRYTTDDADSYGQDLIELMRKQNKWNVDKAIGEDISIFGETYELVFMPKDKDVPDSIEIDPKHGFVAFAGDVERDSVFGVVVFTYKNDKDEVIYHIYVYDTMYVSEWEANGSVGSPRTWKKVSTPILHGFGRVPIIRYKNNRRAMSDFESIIELQDAYNSLLSDRQDNQDSFAQAMLVLSGSVIGITPDEINTGKKNLKQHMVLQLDDDAVAQYLVKTTDEAGVQIVQDQYASDIHKFAMVPDLSDEQFAGNASGVAMAYKLFGTDQIVSSKQAEVQKGFTRRTKLYDYRINNPTMNPNYEPLTMIDSMKITFNLNMPQDLSYISNAVVQLTTASILSRKTARTLIPAIPDPEKEDELVREEQDADAERTRETFDYDEVEEQNNLQKDPFMKKDDEDEDTDTE